MSKQTQGPQSVTVPSLGNVPYLTYNGVPVVTTETLARAYGVATARVRQGFVRHKERFQIGKHYFKIDGEDLNELRESSGERADLYVSERYLQRISPQARQLILWTAIGAARHAKILESDQAWEVFEVLEANYFQQQGQGKELPKTTRPPALPVDPPANGRQIRWVGCAVNALLNFRYQNGVVMKPGEVRAEIAGEMGFERLEELPESKLQAAQDLTLKKICEETGLEYPEDRSEEANKRRARCEFAGEEILEIGHRALSQIRDRADQALSFDYECCRVADARDSRILRHKRQVQCATELFMHTFALISRSVDLAGEEFNI